MKAQNLFTSLSAIRRADANRYGHKAANLGEAIGAGLPVPDGFALPYTLDAGDSAVQMALRPVLERIIDDLGGTVAVRSSGLVEDLPDKSFAGQYESVLNVRGVDDAFKAIATCAASVRLGRVDAYDSSVARHSMAILVQRMLAPKAAGVAFGADPITGRRTDAVVVAVPGLGEALVGGQARGSEWTVPDGGRPKIRSGADGSSVLEERSIMDVAAMVRRASKIFGSPQDIEWAFADGQLWLLQSRPMTALPEEADWTSPAGFSGIRVFRFGEWLVEPVTPLFATWFLPTAHAAISRAVERHGFFAPKPPGYCLVNGWYFTAPTGSMHPLAFFARAFVRHPRRMAKFVSTMRHPETVDGVSAPLLTEWRTRVQPECIAFATRSREIAGTGTVRELMQLIEDASFRAGEVMFSLLVLGGFAWKAEASLADFVRKHLFHITDTHQPLVCALGEAPRNAFEHAVHSLDWFHPTLGELDLSGNQMIETRQPDAVRRRVALESACHAALRDSPKMALRFKNLLDVSQRYAVLREEQSELLTRPWPSVRLALNRLGEVAVSRGALTEVEDVFFLERSELEQAVNGTVPAVDVKARRTEWKRQRRLRPPDTVGPRGPLLRRMIRRADALGRRDSNAPAFIKGLGVSPGRATGVVRVITSPEQSGRLNSGEILVTTATTPAWTPLFTRAAAVVTDTGSLAAHASLVAREYGLPAVVGTGDATRRLRDGMVVLVDGTRGTVELLAVRAQ